MDHDVKDPATEHLEADFSRTVRMLREHYEVGDVIPDKAKLLFILESPHTQELRFGAPVSGFSGASMSHHLVGPDYCKVPLGRLVKDGLADVSEKIGLMNVLSIPLQSGAYGSELGAYGGPSDTDVSPSSEQFTSWFEAMETVRSNNSSERYRSPRANVVQAFLRDGLREKLERLVERDLTIVPCGKFASKFFRLAAVTSPRWTVISDVPHPSYNTWDKEQYRPAIDAVVRALQEA